jgi:poly-gamma-glutamate capsule biosynthesis protein CapA/YwtB (metallophosphatase superfamily)
VRHLLLLVAALLGLAPAGAPARAPERPVRLTVAASGDLLVHTPVAQRALALGGGRRYDFAPLFAPVRPVIAGADLALCHMETPLVPGPVQGYPVFHTPPALARSVKRVGWDACSTASNHSLDAGQYGIDSTLHALRRAGVKATGTSRSARARGRTTMLRANGVRVAFLSYTAVTNGQAVPHPWSVNWASPRAS